MNDDCDHDWGDTVEHDCGDKRCGVECRLCGFISWYCEDE